MSEILILTCEVCNNAFYDRDPEETWCEDCYAADLEQEMEVLEAKHRQAQWENSDAET